MKPSANSPRTSRFERRLHGGKQPIQCVRRVQPGKRDMWREPVMPLWIRSNGAMEQRVPADAVPRGFFCQFDAPIPEPLAILRYSQQSLHGHAVAQDLRCAVVHRDGYGEHGLILKASKSPEA